MISGGGMKGFAILGSIQYLEQQDIIQDIQKFIGTSIGAIICVLISIGYSASDIIIEIIGNKVLKNLDNYSIYTGIRGEGFLNYSKFEKILENLVLKKLQKLPTLQELFEKTKKDIKIVTFNYSKRKEVILSHENYPDLPVMDALHMSSNVPFVFGNFKYEDEYFFDGFITSNFPINIIDIEKDNSIGINALKETWKSDDENGISSWKMFWNLFILPFYEIQVLKNKEYTENSKVININLNDFSFLNFKLSNKQLLDLFSVGYSQTKIKFTEKN